MLEKNHIYQMDCLDFLDAIADESVDLIVADPPYNMNKAPWDSFDSHELFLSFNYAWLGKAIQKLKKTGSLYVFNTPFNSAYLCQFLVEQGLVFQNWITWDKRDGLGAAKKRYSNAQETILFFTKSKNILSTVRLLECLMTHLREHLVF